MGHKRRIFYYFFLSSFQFLIHFFRALHLFGSFFFFCLYFSLAQSVSSLSKCSGVCQCVWGCFLLFFSLCIRKYTICKKPTVSLTQGSRRGGGCCLDRSGKCLRQLKQAPNSPRNGLKQSRTGLCDKPVRKRGAGEGKKPFGHS